MITKNEMQVLGKITNIDLAARDLLVEFENSDGELKTVKVHMWKNSENSDNPLFENRPKWQDFIQHAKEYEYKSHFYGHLGNNNRMICAFYKPLPEYDCQTVVSLTGEVAEKLDDYVIVETRTAVRKKLVKVKVSKDNFDESSFNIGDEVLLIGEPDGDHIKPKFFMLSSRRNEAEIPDDLIHDVSQYEDSSNELC